MSIQRTPLFEEHLKLNAQMVPFAGWEMPVRYSGLIQEHLACRSAAGLFDVSHMGEILVTGPTAEKTLNYLCCNDLTKINDGQAQYSALLNPAGGVIDDLIIYRFHQEKFFICVNASNAENNFQWMLANNKYQATIVNLSSQYGQVAIQGPQAESILSQIFPNITSLKYFYFQTTTWQDTEVIIARTGYTGEDGFEVYVPAELTAKLWQELLRIGGDNLTPCGLGARDTLRLEAAYPLHGHELSPETPALHSGLGWIVKLNKPEFIGQSALAQIAKEQKHPKLCGIELTDPGIAREHTKVFNLDGKEIGYTTSGTKTPTVNKSICLGIIDSAETSVGNKVLLEIRGKKAQAQICALPFYRRS